MKFLKVIWNLFKVLVLLVLLVGVVSELLSIPGCNRFKRYCSYGSMQEMTAAEADDIWEVVPFRQDGSNFTAVVAAPCRFMASGPAVLIYDSDGKLIDCNRDIGDYGYRSRREMHAWKFRR